MKNATQRMNIWLEMLHGRVPKIEARDEAAISKAQRWLEQGKLLGIQGWGTIYLTCMADHPSAVAELRKKLGQPEQPLPLLFRDLQSVGEFCRVDKAAEVALKSEHRPLLILEKRLDTPLSKLAAPYLKTLPVRLPKNHLEHMLFQKAKKSRFSLGAQSVPLMAILQADSAWIVEIAGLDPGQAIAKLGNLAAGFLMHDGRWETSHEDTVLTTFHPDRNESEPPSGSPSTNTAVIPLRLGRGWAPLHIRLTGPLPPVLASGSERDNTICLARKQDAYISPHNGDLSQHSNLAYFESSLDQLQKLSGIQPEILAHDLDTGQLATRIILEKAQREALPAVAVQHHHAHLAACLAENGRQGQAPAIGVIFDLGGLGEDSQKGRPVIWGGEFLVANGQAYERPYHLAYQPLPGGDSASRIIARKAMAYLWEAGIEWEIDIPSVAAVCAQEISLLRSMLKHKLNTPLHSSLGILFEAVTSLAGLRQETSYPAQALWELEAAADTEERETYSFDILETAGGPGQIDPLPVIRSLVEDARANLKPGRIAARFHNGVAELVYQVCTELRIRQNVTEVALSGEVWQNLLLLQKTARLLQQGGFKVYIHRHTPPNPACISLGQAVIAGQRFTS
jgi:hydrogenase maturation protein HypF